jgi:hypothetical protein
MRSNGSFSIGANFTWSDWNLPHRNPWNELRNAHPRHHNPTIWSLPQKLRLQPPRHTPAPTKAGAGRRTWGQALDTDGDGLPDTWENTYFPGLSQVPSGDPDGDLTTNLEEYQNGTSPVVAQVYSEVSKSGMTASGSSDTTGWEFSGAIDFAQGDAKGWHCSGSAYGNAVEFLRLDLASAQSVGRIAYRPRAMSGDPLNGGDWNGVFRRYQIYVTDNFSAAIGDWGPPVASGGVDVAQWSGDQVCDFPAEIWAIRLFQT